MAFLESNHLNSVAYLYSRFGYRRTCFQGTASPPIGILQMLLEKRVANLFSGTLSMD